MISASEFASTPDEDEFARMLAAPGNGKQGAYDKNAVTAAVSKSAGWIRDLVWRDQAETALDVVKEIIPVVLENPGISLDEALELAFPDAADDTECRDCGWEIRKDPDENPYEYMHADYQGNRNKDQDDFCGEARPKTAADAVKEWLEDD